VLEVIPLVGPLVVAIIAVIVAALYDPVLAVWTAAFLAVVRIIEDYVIYPRLIGRDIHLHPLVVIIAVLAGVELGGVAGIFIAVPLVALTTVVVRHWLHWRGGDGERLPLAPSPVITVPVLRAESQTRDRGANLDSRIPAAL